MMTCLVALAEEWGDFRFTHGGSKATRGLGVDDYDSLISEHFFVLALCTTPFFKYVFTQVYFYTNGRGDIPPR